MRSCLAAAAVLSIIAPVSALAQSSTAQYEVTFDVTWSSTSHPGAFPGGAHFSPLIGAVHNDNASFWEPGGIATNGIEIMAETGSTRTLEGEINSAISDATALVIVSGPGAGAPDAVATTFEATTSHDRLTLVTMIAPSPDWFVGLHALPLRENNEWIKSLTIPLDAYDAGTDSGTAFNSSNVNIFPHIPIENIQNEPPFAGLPVLGSFTLTLLSVETCLADVNSDGMVTPTDFNAWISAFNNNLPECDQNQDGLCTPTDFNAWIANFNAGC